VIFSQIFAMSETRKAPLTPDLGGPSLRISQQGFAHDGVLGQRSSTGNESGQR
jgi:hypothetical protein